MKFNRVLATGAAGMVGSYLPEVFGDRELILTDKVGDFKRLDVRDRDAVMNAVVNSKPDLVLHLAAETDVDLCEEDPDLAYHTNAIGTHNVALACQSTGSLLVYISTAAVFDGNKEQPYTEFDDTDASNIYGDSKLQGEKAVAALLNRFFIFRAGWMIGGGEKDKKFVGVITKLILEGRNELQAVNDKFGSPTYAKDFLYGIKDVIETNCYGLFHMANSGCISRYDIALAISRILGRDDIKIEAVTSEHFPLPAPRGRSEAVTNYKLELSGLYNMRPWEEALEEYIKEEILQNLTKEE